MDSVGRIEISSICQVSGVRQRSILLIVVLIWMLAYLLSKAGDVGNSQSNMIAIAISIMST